MHCHDNQAQGHFYRPHQSRSQEFRSNFLQCFRHILVESFVREHLLVVVAVVAGIGSAFVVAFVVLEAVEVVVDVAAVAVLILAAAAAVLVLWLLVLDFVPHSRFLALGSLGHHLCHR